MTWSPAAWNDVSVVGLLTLIVAAHAFALLRGWMVPGPHHREVMEAKDDALADAQARAIREEEINAKLTTALADKNAAEQANAHLLQAIRDAIGAREGQP